MLKERIFQYRRRLGYSQEQLSEIIGVSRQTISKWESGVSVPELDKLIALADCFGITVDQLVRENGQILHTEDSSGEEMSEEKPIPKHPIKLRRWVGIGLCALGLMGLIFVGLTWLMNPASVDVINQSSALTISGAGVVFAICGGAVIAGIYLILGKSHNG